MKHKLLAISQDYIQTFIDTENIKISNENIKAFINESSIDNDLINNSIVKLIDNTAIIKIKGPIFSQESFFSWLMGGINIEAISNYFQKAADSQDIENIILHIDSPGGDVTGINEFAQKVFNARNKKNIIAYVSGAAASAAYWIASAASQIIVDQTSELGSIGVIMGYSDTKKRDEKNGIIKHEIISSVSPLKRDNAGDDTGKAVLQKRVDDLANVFVSEVAKNRNVGLNTVKENFGRGNEMIGNLAVQSGMADKIGSLDSILDEFSKNKILKRGKIMTVEKLTKEQIITQYPSITSDLKKEGAASVDIEAIKIEAIESENKRIASILAIQILGFETIIENAIKDSNITAEKVAFQILEEQKSRGVSLSNIQADATNVPHTPVENQDENAKETERKQAISFMVAGANGGK